MTFVTMAINDIRHNGYNSDAPTSPLGNHGNFESQSINEIDDAHLGLNWEISKMWTNARWFRTAKNRDVSNGQLACPLAHSLAPLTHSLAPHSSIRSRAPLRSFTYSRAHGKKVYV